MSVLVVSLNLALDHICVVSERAPTTGVFRAEHELLSAGGKGVNVARSLGLLDVPTKVIGFCAGATGQMVTDLASGEGITVQPVLVPGDTRIATVLVFGDPERYLVVNPPGPTVGEESWRSLEALAVNCMTADQPEAVICTGSLPPGTPGDAYYRILHQARRRGIIAVVDARGDALRAALAAQPDLVKVNLDEAREISTLGGHSEPAQIARELAESGASSVVITAGADRVVGLTSESLVCVSPPRARVRNAIGAGDTLLGGMVAAMVANQPFARALAAGVAAGTASVEELQPGRFLRERMTETLAHIEISINTRVDGPQSLLDGGGA